MHIDLNDYTSASISGLGDVIEAAREIIARFDNDTAWWRGHANSDWPLFPQVFRRNSENVPLYKEAPLLGHFVSRAPTRSHRAGPNADDYFG
jgi:hypothetical protein